MPEIPSTTPELLDPRELVVTPRGRVRQAGATLDEGALVTETRRTCERDLWFFMRTVLKRTYLNADYHRQLCQFVQHRPPQRKCALEPRGHGKTSVGGHGLPLHCFIQPLEANCYFPGTRGVETRLLLACETERRAKDHVRIVRTVLEGNRLFRAFWPHVVWEKPNTQAKVWNDAEFILPRGQHEYPDPSLRGVGCGAAMAGSHPSALIKDDIIAEAAANSPVIMAWSVDWHRASRAFINEAMCLEWIFGTLWNMDDLYQTEVMPDPTVEVSRRAVVEHGMCIWPERFCLTDHDAEAWNATHPELQWKKSVEQLQRESGVYFPLFYLNEPCDPTLTDFQPDQLRTYTVDGETIGYPADPRDATVQAARSGAYPHPAPTTGHTAPAVGRGAWPEVEAETVDRRSPRRQGVLRGWRR